MRERPNLAHNLICFEASQSSSLFSSTHVAIPVEPPVLGLPSLHWRAGFLQKKENKNHCLRCKIIKFRFRRLAIVSITVEYISESTTPSFQRLRTMAEFRDIKLNKNTPIFDNLHNIHKHWTIHSLHAISGQITFYLGWSPMSSCCWPVYWVVFRIP